MMCADETAIAGFGDRKRQRQDAGELQHSSYSETAERDKVLISTVKLLDFHDRAHSKL